MYISFENMQAVVWYSLSHDNSSSPDGQQKPLDRSAVFEICVKLGDIVSPLMDWTTFKFNFIYID